MKGFKDVDYISSPFPKLLGANRPTAVGLNSDEFAAGDASAAVRCYGRPQVEYLAVEVTRPTFNPRLLSEIVEGSATGKYRRSGVFRTWASQTCHR